MTFETVEIPTKVLGESVLYEGHTNKIKIDRYYDLDGEKIYDKDHPCEMIKGDFNIKVVSTNRLMYDSIRCDIWTLYVNGEKKCTIDSYAAQKTQFKVTDVWGWG